MTTINYIIMIYTKSATLIHGEAPLNILSDDIHQLYPDTCAIKSQQLILRDFGFNFSEDQLRNEAIMYGWYNGGTSPQDVGKLLELHGIPVSQYENANIFNIVNELAQGHKVIVGVDAGELWGEDSLDQIYEDNTADHALIVSGVDTSDPNNVKVILTDPGTGNLLKEYSMEEFVEAWEDSNCFMMTTNNSVPEIFTPFNSLPGFDIPMTNLPMIGHMPYDIFFNDLAYLNFTNNIPECVFNDFSDFVGGEINAYSIDTMDYFDSLLI